jgi:hypothetical protein
MTEREWLACTDSVQMLRFAQKAASERKVRLYLCGGCRHVQYLFFDPASIAAVEVAERFADGLATEEELSKAEWAAESPTFGYDFEAHYRNVLVGRQEILARLVEKGAVSESALHGGEWRVDEAVKSRLLAAALLADSCACSPSESDWWFSSIPEVEWPGRWLSDCVFGDLFSEVRIEPAWLAANDGVAPRLAQAAYDERLLPSGHLEPARLAVLADALEDAGCNDVQLLGHLRGPGPHVRGCWATDLLLAKG